MSEVLQQIKKELTPYKATLVAVSKTKPEAMIQDLYDKGQRIFGENKAQELKRKYENLPKDIKWHMIGHLQSNKVKNIAPFVSLIHSIDSQKLLIIVDKEAQKNERVIKVLLQVKIAREEGKFGLNLIEIDQIIKDYNAGKYPNIILTGLMGMATFTEDTDQLNKEFQWLKSQFDQTLSKIKINVDQFKELSMGMSGDYPLALKNGSTMVRIGSKLFGARNY